MDFPVIISFYTENTPYEEEVKNLIASCKKFQLETSIEGKQAYQSWELNCAYKPFFILEKLEELQKAVLWVDADGVFIRQPIWQDVFAADFSVRINENLPLEHPSKVISSTVFVNNSPLGKNLIREWIRQCHRQLLDPKRREEFWDQIALREAMKKSQANICPLPVSYAKIFDHPQDCEQILEPVIEHYQASRRYKNFYQ